MNALISVSDKSGIAELAHALHALGVGLISTGGTAQLLRDQGLPVREVADVTGFPEMLDGRVKTLHPLVHGGLLARRDLPAHMQALQAHGIDTIDLLVVNLYPFEATVAQPGCTLEDAIENIDIGGPAMVRSAAKNWKHVAVLTDATQYGPVVDELRQNGSWSDTTRFALAVAAFNRISQYDGAISDHLSRIQVDGKLTVFPWQANGRFVKLQDLRYGENPHQLAAFYRDVNPAPGSLVMGVQLQGKELSYNNIADADAAWECVKSFATPACVIVKHANPCGVALGADALQAYRKAFQTDPTSAFGGIIAFNCAVDLATAEAVHKQFVEVLIAPSYSADALALLQSKANVRVMQIDLPKHGGHQAHWLRRVDANRRQPCAASFRPEGGDAQATHTATNRRPVVRLEGGQVCEKQRHRVLPRRHDHGRGCRSNEPPGLGPHRRHQSRSRQLEPARHGGGQRRLLPLPRRPGCGGGRGRDLRHSTRWFNARPRSD